MIAHGRSSVEVAHLTIHTRAGGCVPGYLECVCGHSALAMWEPTMGALCERCERCWGFPMRYAGPGPYTLIPIPPVEALLA